MTKIILLVLLILNLNCYSPPASFHEKMCEDLYHNAVAIATLNVLTIDPSKSEEYKAQIIDSSLYMVLVTGYNCGMYKEKHKTLAEEYVDKVKK